MPSTARSRKLSLVSGHSASPPDSWTPPWTHLPRSGRAALAIMVWFLVLLSPQAVAATLKGSLSCEEWRETRVEAAAGKQAARLDEITAKYWIIGYLSALVGAQADTLRNDPLKNASNEKIYGSIDLYCADNPGKQLPDAIVNVWLEIAKFKKSKKK